MENQLLPISPSETQGRSDSTDQLIRQWLFIFGIEHKEDIAPRLPLWLEAFGGMDAETLEPLFRTALKTCKFFPKISDILQPLQAVEHVDLENEWQSLLDYCREWVHPDIQFSRAPQLPPEIDHAARAAGGVHFLRGCSHEELGWRKKAFIEDLQRSRKNGDLAGLLTGGELRKLLRKAASPAALLPNDVRPTAVAPARRNLESEGDTLLRIAPPSREITPIGIEERLAELQRQAEIIRQKYPTLGNTTGIPPELLTVKASI